jgi:hypothetical protein
VFGSVAVKNRVRYSGAGIKGWNPEVDAGVVVTSPSTGRNHIGAPAAGIVDRRQARHGKRNTTSPIFVVSPDTELYLLSDILDSPVGKRHVPLDFASAPQLRFYRWCGSPIEEEALNSR